MGGSLCRRGGTGTDSLFAIVKGFQNMGVGTELHKILAGYGIRKSPDCHCDDLIRLYDSNGVAWCEEHFDEIVETL
jgi:hypothetical protein